MSSTSLDIRVLLVQSNPESAERVATSLERESDRIAVRTTTTPEDGLSSLADGAIDCIISGYDVPGQNALEFLQTVREDHPDLPFVIFADHGSEEFASDAITAGVTDYIPKNGDPDQYTVLAARIVDAVSRYRSKTNYQELFEKIDIGVTIHPTEDGTILDANQAFADIVGYDREDVLGMNPGELSPSGWSFGDSDAEELVTRTLREGQQSFEWHHETENGDERLVDVTLTPATLDGQQRVLASVVDITDQKAQQAKLEGILEAAHDVAFVIAEPVEDGTDALIREFSPGAENLFGYERAEAIGESLGLLHRQAETEEISNIHGLIDSGESWYDEVEHVRKDGSTFDALSSVHPLDLGGKTCFLGVSIDISERKQRERALERLHDSTRDLMTATTAEEVAEIGSRTAAQVLDQSMNGIHRHDDEGTLVPVAWTDDSEEMLDGPPPALPIEDSLAGRVYRSGDPERYTDIADHTSRFATDTPFGSEIILPLGDHGVFILSSMSTDGFDRIDETLARVLAANIEAAFDRVEQRRQLERQNERLEEFASVLSHDLRNPLNVAEGRLELARSACDSEHLAVVEEAHTRIQTLIDDVLTLAREGNQVGDLEPVDLDSVIEGCWGNVETEQASIRSTADRTVRADRSRLQQVFENLFRNAVQHGGSEVTVTVGMLDGGFFVEDDGPGVPPEDRGTAVEIGYSTSGEGSGFGLSIVDRIVEAHGWDLTLTDGVDGGARFEITDVDIVGE